MVGEIKVPVTSLESAYGSARSYSRAGLLTLGYPMGHSSVSPFR